MQKGYIFRKGPSWFLRYREPTVREGKEMWREVCRRIAPYGVGARSKRDVEPQAHKLLSAINTTSTRPDTATLLAQYIEHIYFPTVKKRPSTIRGYRHIFEKHLKTRLGSTRLWGFRTVNGQNLLSEIEAETELSHTSLKHVKHFLTGVFTFAKQRGHFDSENPMRDVEIPGGRPSKDTHAYSLEEILMMIEKLPEPAKTVVATAAFTGLRRSELRGLKWEDYKGDELRVARSVWETHVIEDTKTVASRASVPVLPILRDMLDSFPHSSEFIFAGAKMSRPLNLSNLARRVIVPTLKKDGTVAWKGWHGFRRGLATNLNRLGVQDKVIQGILRHSNVATTMDIYVKTVSKDAHSAMRRLQKGIRSVERHVERKKAKESKNAK